METKTIEAYAPENGKARGINPIGYDPENSAYYDEEDLTDAVIKHRWQDFEQSVITLDAFDSDGKPLKKGWSGKVTEVWKRGATREGMHPISAEEMAVYENFSQFKNRIPALFSTRCYIAHTPAQVEESEQITMLREALATQGKRAEDLLTDREDFRVHIKKLAKENRQLIEQTTSLQEENQRLREALEASNIKHRLF